MNKKELKELMKSFEDFKFQDYINLDEDKSSNDYEKGFNMAIGLCLSTLDELIE